ncbi:MAG: putative quinol monooxygenase [Rikenellaceae bacterium]
MSELKIIATITVKAECQEAMQPIFKAVVEGTRQEEGNVSYVLHQDVKNPCKYVMVEVWKSLAAIDSHNASAHFGDFVKDSDGMLEAIDVAVIREVM